MDMAQRLENGRTSLVQSLALNGEISVTEAERVADYYLKHSIARLEVGIGSFRVGHGAFLEPETINRALELC